MYVRFMAVVSVGGVLKKSYLPLTVGCESAEILLYMFRCCWFKGSSTYVSSDCRSGSLFKNSSSFLTFRILAGPRCAFPFARRFRRIHNVVQNISTACFEVSESAGL